VCRMGEGVLPEPVPRPGIVPGVGGVVHSIDDWNVQFCVLGWGIGGEGYQCVLG